MFWITATMTSTALSWRKEADMQPHTQTDQLTPAPLLSVVRNLSIDVLALTDQRAAVVLYGWRSQSEDDAHGSCLLPDVVRVRGCR